VSITKEDLDYMIEWAEAGNERRAEPQCHHHCFEWVDGDGEMGAGWDAYQLNIAGLAIVELEKERRQLEAAQSRLLATTDPHELKLSLEETWRTRMREAREVFESENAKLREGRARVLVRALKLRAGRARLLCHRQADRGNADKAWLMFSIELQSRRTAKRIEEKHL
jgi:hypothetical protein